MLQLNRESLKDKDAWLEAGIRLPLFDHAKMVEQTRESPSWIHFGAGNIFRGFIAVLQQQLLDAGLAETGIIAVEAYDHEIIDRIYAPHDNLGLLVIMNADGSLEKTVVGGIAEGLVGDPSRTEDWQRLQSAFKAPTLQMVSFTITEKGYSLTGSSGSLLPDVAYDMEHGPLAPRSIIGKLAALVYTRYLSGELPVALVSMDNCSHNGEKLYSAVATLTESWAERKLIERGFLKYLKDPKRVSFPWSMIDKITPRPSEAVGKMLASAGFEDTDILCTAKNTYIAPFINAEGPQYLVVEDLFPNGRPLLEKAGVHLTDRATVDRVERMKVCTCLNPLHTALAIYGCLLGYTSIADEMKDPLLKKLVEKIGYNEGMPVVVNPGIIDPETFIREVVEKRFPNPYIPDTPQRIVSDTSQKTSIRFGETIKAYSARKDLDPAELKYIPLVIAGWCRYLMGLDDNGDIMALSPDPLMDELQAKISGIRLGDASSVENRLKPILSSVELFGTDLYQAGLGEKIEGYFKELIAGRHAVRNTLKKHLE